MNLENLNQLQPTQVIRIWCKSRKSNYLDEKPNSTLICWVNELVVVGQILEFSNYRNYADGWIVTKIDRLDTKSNVEKQYGDVIKKVKG